MKAIVVRKSPEHRLLPFGACTEHSLTAVMITKLHKQPGGNHWFVIVYSDIYSLCLRASGCNIHPRYEHVTNFKVRNSAGNRFVYAFLAMKTTSLHSHLYYISIGGYNDFINARFIPPNKPAIWVNQSRFG